MSALARGAAVLELALVVPLFVTLLLFGLYFSELVRAKLKLLEAARFAAFELTSHVLDDYGGAGHERAFELASDATIGDAERRFADLDSVATRPAGGFIAGYSGLEVHLANLPVALKGSFQAAVPPGLPEPPHSLDGTAAQAHRVFGLNPNGMVEAEVEVRLDNRILPRHLLGDGQRLQSKHLRARFTVIASAWMLPDGADALMRKEHAAAGVHRDGSHHGLWLQVNRMTHLGQARGEPELSRLQTLGPARLKLPRPGSSTFVVSHHYGRRGASGRPCTTGPGNADPSHPAPAGMNDLSAASQLDVPYRKCFDTAPFRDTAAYDESLSVQQLNSRGDHFMACKNAQADDPSHAGPSPWTRGDRNRLRVDCGGAAR